MSKKYITTLSSKELEIMEGLIARFGNVVDLDMVGQVVGLDKNRQVVKNLILSLTKKGWLVRIKRGLFVVSDIAGRGSVNLSQLAITQLLDNSAYLSFEIALQHHGLFDQYLRTVTSITKKRAHSRQLADSNYRYIKAKQQLFGDFKKHNIDGQLVRIASLEKVVIDFLTYRRTAHNIDLVIEKLRNYQGYFDIQRLITISKDCSITTKRTLGVILDTIGIDSSRLHKMIKDNKNHSFVTKDSDQFNAKWRIYVNNGLVK